MSDKPAVAAQVLEEPQPPPPLPPDLGATSRKKARARALRRTLVRLSIASGLFAVGAWWWRQSQRLPDVRMPSFVCTAQTEEAANIGAFETNLLSLRGLDAVEVTERATEFEALVFGKDKAQGKALRIEFAGWPAHNPWIIGPDIEAPPRDIAIIGGQLSGVERRALIEGEGGLRAALLKVPGIRAVDVCGGALQEAWFTLQNARLAALGVSSATVAAALRGGGTLLAPDLKTLLATPIAASLKLMDLGQLELVAAPTSCHASRGSSEDVAFVRVSLGQDGEGAGGLQRALDDFEKTSPPGVHIRMVTSSRPTHMHFRMPSAATPDWRALDRKLKTLSQAPDAYVLKDDRGIEALVEMPDDDGRKPEEFARFLRNELSKSFGCVYSARTPALRLRLLGDDKVLDAAEAFALAAQAEPGVLAAKVISPARARAFLPQRPRFHQLGIDPSLAMDALALSTTGQTVQGQLRLKMDEPFERATLVLKPGVSVPLTELFQLDEPSHRTALRVNRTPTADVCVTSASLSPEELAARLVPLAKGRGLLVEAARLSVR